MAASPSLQSSGGEKPSSSPSTGSVPSWPSQSWSIPSPGVSLASGLMVSSSSLQSSGGEKPSSSASAWPPPPPFPPPPLSGPCHGSPLPAQRADQSTSAPIPLTLLTLPGAATPSSPNASRSLLWAVSTTRARSAFGCDRAGPSRSEEHTSELQSRQYLVCRLLLEQKKSTSH